MKGLKPIRTVADLMAYLAMCPPTSEIMLMPEDGEGFQIGGVLELSTPKEVWILIDEFSQAGGPSMEWSSGGGDDDEDAEEAVERPGDMSTALTDSTEIEEIDIIEVRGKLRSA